MTVMHAQPSRIDLVGLDGRNLLAYMAALGTLRTLAQEDAEVRLSWSEDGARWMPSVHSERLRTPGDILAALERSVCGKECPAFAINLDLTFTAAEFRKLAQRAADESASDRTFADFIAAFGSEACVTKAKSQQIQDTALRTMSGAGHQHFLGFMQELAASTNVEHLRKALLLPWDYSDGKPSMRWDPNDYRPHALRADDPAKDPIKTMRGANRLALEALPLFATMPRGALLKTTAFNQKSEITWPIWTQPLNYDTISSVLALSELQQEGISRTLMQRHGISQVFRAARFTEGKFRNFTPSRELM